MYAKLIIQVRHGVAMALREVIKLHGNTAGISVYTPLNKVRWCALLRI